MTVKGGKLKILGHEDGGENWSCHLSFRTDKETFTAAPPRLALASKSLAHIHTRVLELAPAWIGYCTILGTGIVLGAY